MKLSGYLSFAAYHKREMRVLNRVLIWISSEVGRAEMITYEEIHDPRISCSETLTWSTGES